MNTDMTPDEAKQFVIEAVKYALENHDPNLDYGKYVAKEFINTIDDSHFNFDQWVQHQKNIKTMVRSMQPEFECLVSDGSNVFVSFFVRSIKNDGTELIVKDLAHFIIKNRKIVFCDELTKLLKGAESDQHFASMK